MCFDHVFCLAIHLYQLTYTVNKWYEIVEYHGQGREVKVGKYWIKWPKRVLKNKRSVNYCVIIIVIIVNGRMGVLVRSGINVRFFFYATYFYTDTHHRLLCVCACGLWMYIVPFRFCWTIDTLFMVLSKQQTNVTSAVWIGWFVRELLKQPIG